MDLDKIKVKVIIPCYKVEKQIRKVVEELPDYVHSIILVNDKSPDSTPEILSQLAQENPKVTVVNHDVNQGVGGAMISGFLEALKTEGDFIVKLDGDGQMDASYIKKMVSGLESDGCDFAKGNRFFDRKELAQMPFIRRLGNLGLSFLIKMSSGYWKISDPTNGFFCIRQSTLQRIDTKRLSKRFFFECSLLIESFYAGAKIKDVAIPAIYADEKSNLSIFKTLLTFPPKLSSAFIRRIWRQYFVYDFNICSIYWLFGNLLFLFGAIFGIVNWVRYASAAHLTPTGTIMLSILPLILGFQMLLSAIQYDISAANPFEIRDNA